MKRFLIVLCALIFALFIFASCKGDDFNKGSGHYGNTSTETETDDDISTDTSSNSSTDTSSDVEADSSTDTDTDADTGTSTDIDTDTDTSTDTDTDTDTSTDTDTDTDTNTDTDTETDVEEDEELIIIEYITSENGLVYGLKTDNTLAVISYTGTPGSFTIPTEYNGYSITEIADYAFYGYENQIASGGGVSIGFVTIRISETVTKIGKGAFKNCDNVKVQFNSTNATLTREEWVSILKIEGENEGVLDTINYRIPAIGWGAYIK